MNEAFSSRTPVIPVRGIHLDLKGLPPTSQRLLSLLDLFAALRINCVLVEWEDTFPWEVDRRFRSETAYTVAQVDAFHARAKALGIEVIPLVQSLGHMETPLQPADYAHLREVSDRCDVLNPLAKGGRELVERMIDDVLARTPSLKHFHLGGDEAWTFGTHPDTKAFIAKHGKAALYLHHVEPLLDKLNARGVRPILWHDMMHEWDQAALAKLAKKADLMFWTYWRDPETADGAFSIHTVRNFAKAGVPLWGACAYKGADGPEADLPDVEKRIINTKQHVKMHREFSFKGVVATAWSRYATHRPQCEPIDGALDSLVKVAAVMHDGEPCSDADVETILRKTGDWDRFKKCRGALAKFSEARKNVWQFELWVRQQAVTEAQDARRRGSGMTRTLQNLQRENLKTAEEAAKDVKASLEGLIEPIWIDRYLSERVVPLRSLV